MGIILAISFIIGIKIFFYLVELWNLKIDNIKVSQIVYHL